MKRICTAVMLLAALLIAGLAQATTFTSTSPAGGLVPSGVSTIGGVVLDLIGSNDVRVVSQLPASSLFVGFYDFGTPPAFNGNPGTIGIQTGFGPSVTGALGGGLKQAAVRFSLYDGDSAAGNFDYNDNTLLVNNLNFGNWSSVNAEETDSLGNTGGAGFSGGGFRNNILDTGWFNTTDATLLGNFFSSLVNSQQVVFQVNDVDPYDNFYDFTQGIDAGLINVGQGPTVQPPNQVPEPATILVVSAGLLGIGIVRKRIKN